MHEWHLGAGHAVSAETFEATLEPRSRGGIAIRLPFDPNGAWGAKDRHYVAGTIGGHSFRGALTVADSDAVLELGPSWCRDPRVGPGAHASVTIAPEGPQVEDLAPDLRSALAGTPKARRFFESLATFYRNDYVTWVEGAKRPDTRSRRIADAVAALKAGRRERL